MTQKKKRKNWKDEDMISAMSAVNSKEMTIYKAVAMFNVPRKTLDDRIKGHVKHGTKPGPPTATTPEQEDALVSMETTSVRNLDLGIIGGPNSNVGTLKILFDELTSWSVVVQRLSIQIISSGNTFELLTKMLDNCGLKNNNKLRQLYNCDETFLPLDCSRKKVVTYKGGQKIHTVSHMGRVSTLRYFAVHLLLVYPTHQ